MLHTTYYAPEKSTTGILQINNANLEEEGGASNLPRGRGALAMAKTHVMSVLSVLRKA
jgi:hypothetical protein